MFTLDISLAVLLSAALLSSERKLQVEADECYSNSDCGFNKSCCTQRYASQKHVCRFSCVGEFCSLDSDCGGPGVCCVEDYCTTKSCVKCSSNSDCGYNKYCCKESHTSQNYGCTNYGCVGEPCSSDSDCGGPDECCSPSNRCTKSGCDECATNLNCNITNNYYCCKQRYSWQASVCGYGGCVGESCSSDSDCGGPGECCNSNNYCGKSPCDTCSNNSNCDYNEYCCKQRYPEQIKICRSGSCVGQFCYWDSDCGGPDECCSSSNLCKESSCDHDETKGLASWLIGVIVVSVLVAVVIPIVIAVRFYRGMASASRGRTQQGQVLNQSTGSTVVALQNIQTVQNNRTQFQSTPNSPPLHFDQGQDVPPEERLIKDLPPAYTEQ